MLPRRPCTITIVVSYTYPFIGSGIGNVALKQAETFARMGHTVNLISANVPETKWQFTKDAVTHIKLPALNWLYRFHIPVPIIIPTPLFFRTIKQTDLVIVHDMLYLNSLVTALVAKVLQKRLVLFQHIAFINYGNVFINLLQRIAQVVVGLPVIICSDLILVLNREIETAFSRHRSKIRRITNGVDTELFHPVHANEKQKLRKRHGLQTNRPIVLFVGRLVPKKGVDIVHAARSPDYLTLCIGTGSIPEALAEDENIRFLGGKDQEELSEFYRLSDVFVLPSHGEGFPLSVQEAMASGLPIVTTNTAHYHDIIDQSHVALIPRTAAGLKNALHAILKDPEKSQAMQKYSRKTALNQFSWQNHCEQIITYYKQLPL
ncbi:MAG: glycosyltransferase family 4 protein [Patescibacteria group bacterium]